MTSGYLGIVFNMVRMVFGKKGASARATQSRAAGPIPQPPPNKGRVSFTQQGPNGQVDYAGEEGSFSLYWEYGGGDALAIIYVPKAEEWEAQTKIPLSKRQEILHHIGSEAIRQNTGGKGRFELDGGWLVVKA
ncbi:MAG: hypothetical protein KIS77_19450 [Saprospiraceae bacterium]|nr:hypothetical protein [Saprospiraceae bacterium]